MSELTGNIRRAIRDHRYVFGTHADERLRERRITAWQVVADSDSARVIRERPDAVPNPVVEFDQLLPDGTPFKAVWAWLSIDQIAKLVTVHFYNR